MKKEPAKYQLPKFDKDKLIKHLDKLVASAPNGVVQLVIDLFCGAGGTSEGIESARHSFLDNLKKDFKCAAIIAGINHDVKAIYSQAKNHPLAYYTTEDIRFANLQPIKELIDILRERYPNCPILIWASLECTNHSNAKGGMSRDADSRTLPWDLYRYIQALNPDGIWIENVKEFAEWGPMMNKVVFHKAQKTIKGKKKYTQQKPMPEEQWPEYYMQKAQEGYYASSLLEWDVVRKKKVIVSATVSPVNVPIPELKGTFFYPWLDKVNAYGYQNQFRVINAADYGVAQNRHRLFIIFMREGWPIEWPHPTHAKSPSKGDLFDPGLKKHVPVKTCLDFSVEGRSVFEPGHVKSPKTWQRIYEGLVKYVAGGKEAYMVQRNGGNPVSKVFTVDGPARTVTATGGNQELVQAFLMKYMGNNEKTGSNPGLSIDNPSNTITTHDRIGLIQPKFIDTIYGNGFPSSMENPAPTVRCKDGMALVTPNFLLNYQGQSRAYSVDEVSPALLTKDKLALMGVKYFLYRAYSGGGYMGSIEEPESAIVTNPKTALMQVEKMPVQTSGKDWQFLINPSWFGSTSSINEPAITIIASQHKAPVYYLSANEVENNTALAIPVFDDDIDIVVQIKEFMALYNIYDIKKRMLMVKELLKIQSFPDDYYLAGTQEDQKKFIGNAVPPTVAQKIAESMYKGTLRYLTQVKFKKAA